MRTRLLTACAIASIFAGVSVAPMHGTARAATTVFSDNFQNGFNVGAPGSNANWFYFQGGSFIGNDGIATTGPNGLTVDSSGTNPNTGKPAFTLTVGQNDGAPGAFDHVKWLVYANHFSDAGYPGFTSGGGQEVACQATIGGQTFGTDANPFHQYVSDPNDDLRLAAIAMPTIDFDTFAVFDTWFTNQHIYAFYEHLPFARQNLGGPYDSNYEAFSSATPIAKRSIGKSDTVTFVYDKDNGIAKWLVNGVEKFRVTNIGERPNRSMMLLDHGGNTKLALPNQIDCGLGMFTLLDGYGKKGVGLVRLTDPNSQPSYYDPSVGEPTPENFVDNQSLPQNRLWGQGAELKVSNFSVQYWPSGT